MQHTIYNQCNIGAHMYVWTRAKNHIVPATSVTNASDYLELNWEVPCLV